MKTLRLLPLLIGCLHAASAAKDIPDFSAGFHKLAALGMPALDSQAIWVRATSSNEYDYELRPLIQPLKGNGWLLPLPDKDGKPLLLPLGTCEPQPSDGTKAPPSQNLERDLDALTRAIAKVAAKKKSDEDRFSMRSGDNSAGRLLLFATQLYQTGHTAEANRLAMDVFSLFPSREAAVNAAIDQLADPLYQKVVTTFFSSGDWSACHRDLAALVERFPRGWSAARAVGMMLPQLEKQAAGTTAPPPSLPDTPLDPRALKALDAWTTKPVREENSRVQMGGGRYMMTGGYNVPDLWLIQAASEKNGQSDSSSPDIHQLGMAAIPVLAALTADPFFTYLPNPMSYRSYYSSDESEEEHVLRIYQSLHRPATRGELACRLLAATLPDPENELDEADPETLREIALSFWKDHREASRDELAVVFMKEGSSSQATAAAESLASSSDPKAHQIFEAHVLAADPAIAHFRAVQTYLRTRRSAAKPFYEKYAGLVRKQSPATEDDSGGYDPVSWQVKQAGGRDKILKQLETLVGAQSPRALAVRIAKGKPGDAETAIKSLVAMLQDDSPTKQLTTLLDGAYAAKQPEIRAHFLVAMFQIPWQQENQDQQSGAPEEDAGQPERAIPGLEAKTWRKLLADTRPLPESMRRGMMSGSEASIAALAAAALEVSASPQNFYQVHASAPIIGKPADKVLLERATARLAGNPLPPLPDATKVSRERLTAIVSEASNQPADAIQPFLTTLTTDERAAWFAWMNEPGDLPPPASVIAARAIITDRAETPFGKDIKGAAGIDIGFTLSTESLEQLVQSLAADPAQHSRTMLMIYPANFPPGLQVTAMVFPPVTPTSEDEAEEEERITSHRPPPTHQVFSELAEALGNHAPASAVIQASVQSQGQPSETMWWIENGKAVRAEINKEDSDESDFSEQLKTLLESPATRFRLQIQILTRADAETFPNEND